MIWALIFGVIILFGVIEFLSLRISEKAVSAHLETDLRLCAPGEEITMRYTVTNNSFLPLFYVCISIHFGGDFYVLPPEEGRQKWTVRKDITGTHVKQRMNLMPHQSCTGRVSFRVSRRGLHTFGAYYVETGDYLGIKTSLRTAEGEERVVCTAHNWEEEPEFNPYGGILGDVSVRRFIHEDPCLITGYRDYTGREPMKQISWRQTAKTGRLTVKQQDHTSDTDVAVLLNMEGGNAEALETCLNITRSVCEKLESRKIPYVFRSNGDLWDMPEGIGRSHLFPILRSLGLSRLACLMPFASLVDRCIREGKPNRTYIVITDETPDAQLQKLQAYSEHQIVSFSGRRKTV